MILWASVPCGVRANCILELHYSLVMDGWGVGGGGGWCSCHGRMGGWRGGGLVLVAACGVYYFFLSTKY